MSRKLTEYKSREIVSYESGKLVYKIHFISVIILKDVFGYSKQENKRSTDYKERQVFIILFWCY